MILMTPSEVLQHAFTQREEISPHSIKIAKITAACDAYVRPRFGDKLYDRFLQGEHTPFVDEYLKPAIAHYVRYSIIDELSVRLSDNGAVLSDQSQTQSNQSGQSVEQQNTTNSTKGEDIITSQNMSDTKTTDKVTTQSEDEVIIEKDENSQSNLRREVDASNNQTINRNQTTNTTDENDKTTDAVQSSSESVEISELKERDYNFHESPQTVGVSTVGFSHDMLENERRATGSMNRNDVCSEERSSSKIFNANDTVSDKKVDETTQEQSGLSTSVQKDFRDSTKTQNAEKITEKQDTDNRSEQISRNVTQTGERTSTKDGILCSMIHHQRSATDFQRRLIRARALADANILIAKAVRYVERNAELFPEYAPSRIRISGILL